MSNFIYLDREIKPLSTKIKLYRYYFINLKLFSSLLNPTDCVDWNFIQFVIEMEEILQSFRIKIRKILQIAIFRLRI